jgi:hypothetical protein
MGLDKMKILATNSGRLRYFLDKRDVEKLRHTEEKLINISRLLKKRKYQSPTLLRLHNNNNIVKQMIWDNIYKKYGLDPHEHYSINTKTSELYINETNT